MTLIEGQPHCKEDFMSQVRRQFLKIALLTPSVAFSTRSAAKTERNTGIPGPYPGRVISVYHPASIVSKQYQREPVRQMMHKGIMELTGVETPAEAWRAFFTAGDVVGIKVNPVGQPHVISAPEVLHEIIDGLKMAGVKPRDMVVYDRYRKQFVGAGFDKWLPEGVRWTWATDEYHPLQLDMDGYDADHYMETALVPAEGNPKDPHHRRSYVARFLTKDVNKMINLCVLKHHQSAGVTLALKNMSHGLVNNVSRSHSSKTLNACGTFIPAVVDLPVIREKVVLHILDGIQGAYHGGPGSRVEQYVWYHKTMYFATDPVALDKIGWEAIDKKRIEMGRLPVGEAGPDEHSSFYRMQPEHIEIAGSLGLGEFQDEKIDCRRFNLG
jgi:uncharacterized protein (DUF362 family)